eukprot:Sspe_Gene.14957::Locus_5184_Transcript_1_1_Confidence_1.000_Length_19510::g.14957::m.14957
MKKGGGGKKWIGGPLPYLFPDPPPPPLPLPSPSPLCIEFLRTPSPPTPPSSLSPDSVFMRMDFSLFLPLCQLHSAAHTLEQHPCSTRRPKCLPRTFPPPPPPPP